jgi:uncharacterized protein YceK
MKHTIPSLAALALLLLSGCGTIANLAEGPRVYGGVRTDVRMIGDPRLPDGTHSSPIAVLAIVDLPLSAALDTALLPITLIFEFHYVPEETPRK